MTIIHRKPKKRLVQVAGNPAYAIKQSPNKEITNPVTGTLDWGHFPEIVTKGKTFPAGPIRLRYGEHKGPEKGFGLAHIWEARKYRDDVLNTPEAAIEVVAQLILAIIIPGAAIYYEGRLAGSSDRATVFKSQAGTVIVEERIDGYGAVFYSIITAIPKNSAKGTLIGRLP
jgi:hypothetical protein